VCIQGSFVCIQGSFVYIVEYLFKRLSKHFRTLATKKVTKVCQCLCCQMYVSFTSKSPVYTIKRRKYVSVSFAKCMKGALVNVHRALLSVYRALL